MAEAEIKPVCRNRRAHFQYEVLETVEAGLVLQGSEVKSLRAGRANLTDAYARHYAEFLGAKGAEVVADATGVPDAVPVAMSLACDGGQVVVVGSPRGKAAEVNFYDDLHRRYIEVTGAHGNMLFEPAHTRLAGAWDIHKAQHWLLRTLANGRLNLAGLVTHSIAPEGLGEAYEGLLRKKDEYLGVLVRWV